MKSWYLIQPWPQLFEKELHKNSMMSSSEEKSEGMQFMDEDIFAKLRMGMISPFEAYMKAIDKKRFKEYLPENLQELAHSGGGEIEGSAASG